MSIVVLIIIFVFICNFNLLSILYKILLYQTNFDGVCISQFVGAISSLFFKQTVVLYKVLLLVKEQ